MAKKVLVAMSGGVDSSVAAYLLKNKGYEVTGVTMCLGVKIADKKIRCCSPGAIEDAKKVCQKLGIPHYVMDFSKELEKKIISKFISEYLKGRTPNPCIDCNKFLKFGILLEKASAMGFDFLATGHYAEVEDINGEFFLKKAEDNFKDQSYFLYSLNKKLLSKILFPLGELTKKEVREIAQELDLSVANKPQSQDICFIQEDYREFLSQRVPNVQEGEIVDRNGKVLGKHKGIFFYTIGQRERLGISSPFPLYIISIDPQENRIVVGRREEIFAQGLVADNINILVNHLPQEAYAKIRSQHKEAKCKIYSENGKIRVIFEKKQPAITPGQSVVLYDKEIVLGGGVIEEVLW